MTKIIEVDALNQHNADLQRYALYISRFRALPDYRDGQKPVQRRILWTMYHDVRGRSKSAKIVGAVIGNYNPHGDAACYDAMAPLANWFETGIPFLKTQGSFGTFQGDGAASQRYTEAELNKFALDVMIGELKDSEKVVDWSLNYSGELEEPDFLPAKLPILLINGTFGIAIGFKVYIPRHNINEVIDATVKLIDNPNAEVVLTPDSSMKCEIVDTDWKAISNKGRGSFVARGIIDIEDYKGHTALVIKSLPDQVFLNSVIDEIEALISKKKLIQIHDLFDESKHETLRYVIVLKKGADPNYVREVLYKSTSMTKTFSVNFEVLDGINPIRMSYKSYLQKFIQFRMSTKFRWYSNIIQNLKTKIHERELYIKVLESGEIDNIIKKIKSQRTIDDNALVEYLIKKLDMTDLQAKFIINSNLSKLSYAYLHKYKSEAAEMEKVVKQYTNFITNTDLILDQVRAELLQYKELYGTKRKSVIIKKSATSEIPPGEFRIIITEDNMIKKLQVNDPIMNRNSALPKFMKVVDNQENLLIVDEMGKVFKLPVHIIPFTDRSSGGIDIRMIIKKLTSNIIGLIYEKDLKDRAELVQKSYVVAVTKNGYIKRMDLEDFITAPPSGITFMKLDRGDGIKSVIIARDTDDVVVYSNTKALRISLEDIPYLKRNTKGLRSMDTPDEIDGIELVPRQENGNIIVFTRNNKMNKFNQSALPLSTRGRKGNKVINLGKNDVIVGLYCANDNDIITVFGAKSGAIDLLAKDIPAGSSVSSGVKVFNIKDTIIKTKITYTKITMV